MYFSAISRGEKMSIFSLHLVYPGGRINEASQTQGSLEGILLGFTLMVTWRAEKIPDFAWAERRSFLLNRRDLLHGGSCWCTWVTIHVQVCAFRIFLQEFQEPIFKAFGKFQILHHQASQVIPKLFMLISQVSQQNWATSKVLQRFHKNSAKMVSSLLKKKKLHP